MADQPTNQNLFAQYGFPMQSPDALIRARMQQNQQLFQKLLTDQAANVNPNDRGIFQSFAQLGQALVGKAPAELTDQEKNQFRIMARANEYMKTQQMADDWAGLDPMEKAMRTQEQLARAALDYGDTGTFAAITTKTAEQRQAARLAEAQINHLNADTEDTKQGTTNKKQAYDMADFKFGVEKQGEQGSYVLKNSDNNFGISKDPELANKVTGAVDPMTGLLHTTDGRTIDGGDYLSIKDFDTLADDYSTRNKTTSGRSPADQSKKDFMISYTPTAARAARDAYQAVQAQGRVLGAITESAAQMEKHGQDPGQMVGPTGDFTVAANKIYNGVRNTLGVFATDVIDDNGKVIAKGYKDAADYYKGFIKLPEGIKEGSKQAAQYQANVMQLVYTEANLNESGGRFSDQDIKNAMKGLGVDSGDFANIMHSLQTNFAKRGAKIASLARATRGIASEYGISPDDADKLIFGENPDATIKDFNDALQTRMDTVAPGATDKPALAPDALTPQVGPEAPNSEARKARDAATKAKIDAL